MPAHGDSRILDLLDEALARGPQDVLQILGALRARAGKLLGEHEGRVHALLHALLKQGHLHVAQGGESGLARYALGKGDAAAGEPSSDPSTGNDAASRTARRIASGVKLKGDRIRIEADVRAHLEALEKRDRTKAFGSARNVRHLLHRVDRKRKAVFFPSGAGDYIRKFAVEEAPWILMAVIAFLLIRAFAAEVFYIPSSSMVPTLLEGDRVVVFKPGAKGKMPDRWSIVTFDRRGTTFVKRVIGLGGESILLQGGDPYIDGELLVRPADLREDLRARYRGWEMAKPGKEWSEADEAGERVLTYVGPTLFSGGYDPQGRPFYPGDVPLRDVYGVLDGTRPAGTVLALELAYVASRDDTASSTLTLRADDSGTRLVIHARGRSPETLFESKEAPTDSVRLQLAYVDGSVILAAPGTGTRELPLDAALRPRRGDIVRPQIRLEGSASAQRFRLDRDHHYTLVGHRAVPNHRGDEDPETYAHPVPEGTVFLLGDNSYSSNDGRFRDVGDIPVDKLIGPVVFRIWPPLRVGGVR